MATENNKYLTASDFQLIKSNIDPGSPGILAPASNSPNMNWHSVSLTGELAQQEGKPANYAAGIYAELWQLVTALISTAIVVLGAVGTFVTTNLTKKSVKTSNDELIKKINEIDVKLSAISLRNFEIEQKLNKINIKNEKRLLRIEKDIFLLQQKEKLSQEKLENEQKGI